MIKQVCLSLALFVALPAWSQVPSAAGGGSQMLIPAPVSGEAYGTEVGSEKRSNFLRAGVAFTTAYGNDVVGELGVNPVNDVGYSIFPAIEIDKTTPRLHLTTTYSPSFVIYQRTSSENQVDQAMIVSFQYRLSRHVTMTLRDSLQKTGNAFNQLNQFTQVSGGVPSSNGAIDLVADQLGNLADAQLTYQFSRNGMVGGEGTFTNLSYLKSPQVPGLYNSSSSGGSAFYSYRLSRRDYIGATYQYSKILAYPPNAPSEIQTNTVLFFYTVYLKPTLSLSLSGGPQHYDISQFPLPTSGSWSPTLTASLGWEGPHTNFAASYSRAITGGGGLAGVFQSNTAGASARWKPVRTWSGAVAANYMTNKDLTPSTFLSSQGGHRILATVSVQHQLSERFRLEFGYTDVHQSYVGIPAITNFPSVNRESISITYNFARPLGG